MNPASLSFDMEAVIVFVSGVIVDSIYLFLYGFSSAFNLSSYSSSSNSSSNLLSLISPPYSVATLSLKGRCVYYSLSLKVSILLTLGIGIFILALGLSLDSESDSSSIYSSLISIRLFG